MTVAELIDKLQKMPQDFLVQVNDNGNGRIFDIDCVDDFPEDEDGPVIMLQVNCE